MVFGEGEGEEEAVQRRQQIRALFDEFDRDKRGRLTLSQFEQGLKREGLWHRIRDDAHLRRVWNATRLDPSDEAGMDFGEFYNIMVEHYQILPHAHLVEVFEDWLSFGEKLSNLPAEAVAGKSRNPWRYLVYGAVSGAVSRTVTAPLERLKILNQVQYLSKGAGPQYGGVWSALVAMGRNEGWRGYFKGNGVNILRIMPSSAARYYAYEALKRALHPENGQPTAGVRMLSGALAGIFATGSTYPLDLVRTRLAAQTASAKYKGLMDATRTIVKEEGVAGLYKGLWTSCLGVAPFVAINFTSYEMLRQWAIDARQGEKPSLFMNLSIGALAGTIAMSITYPSELLRRRMMLQGIGGAEREYKGITDAVVKIARNEGVAGFYRGIVPCYLKVVPSQAVSWGMLELCKKLAGE